MQVIRLQVRPNARDQIVFYAFHSLLVKVQKNTGDICAAYV